MGDRVAECRADMRAIQRAAGEIARTLDSVDALSGTDVWSGPAGDRFRGEWAVHRAAIRSVLQSAQEQAEAILAKVQKEEAGG